MNTSAEAFETIDTSKLERIVYEILLESKKGLISDEVRSLAQIRHGVTAYSSVTARFSSLYRKGLIEYVGKRPGMSGRNQNVMVAVYED